MDIRKLQRAIVDGLEDVKAQNISVFNTEHLTPMFERVIVASGTSNRQTKALASSVRETVKERGWPVLSVEGADNGEWIIVDCGAAVAHIMQPAIRTYYHLEEIWGEKPVRMKIDHFGRPAPAPVRHHDGEPVEDERPAGKSGNTAARPAAPAKKAVGKKAAAKKTTAGKATGAKRPAAKAPSRSPAKSPAKKAIARTSGTKTGTKTSTKTGTKTPARKAPAKRTAASGRR
jgi:ribosome-associated protein